MPPSFFFAVSSLPSRVGVQQPDPTPHRLSPEGLCAHRGAIHLYSPNRLEEVFSETGLPLSLILKNSVSGTRGSRKAGGRRGVRLLLRLDPLLLQAGFV